MQSVGANASSICNNHSKQPKYARCLATFKLTPTKSNALQRLDSLNCEKNGRWSQMCSWEDVRGWRYQYRQSSIFRRARELLHICEMISCSCDTFGTKTFVQHPNSIRLSVVWRLRALCPLLERISLMTDSTCSFLTLGEVSGIISDGGSWVSLDTGQFLSVTKATRRLYGWHLPLVNLTLGCWSTHVLKDQFCLYEGYQQVKCGSKIAENCAAQKQTYVPCKPIFFLSKWFQSPYTNIHTFMTD